MKRRVVKRVVKKSVKNSVKRVVKSKVKKKSFFLNILIGLVMMVPYLFWGGAVKGLLWYHIFIALAFIGAVVTVYNFIKLLMVRERKIVLR